MRCGRLRYRESTIRTATVLTCFATAFALITICVPAFAQSGGSLPNTTIEGGSSANEAPGSSATEAPGAPAPPAARTTTHPATRHHSVAHHASAPAPSAAVEPANAKLKLKEDSWAYASPAKSSKRLEQVHAGKFVNVTGTTHYYVQVRLKSGQTGYVPISSVELTRATDKVFTLTADASVLSEPNHYGKKVSEVHRGHSVHVVGIALNYVKIRMRNGLEGFIPLTALQ